MASSRVKTWSAGEILTASDLNAEFNNLINTGHTTLASPRTASFDMDGQELILDADADTSLTADTDDVIHVRVGGTDVNAIATAGIAGDENVVVGLAVFS